MIRPLLLLPLLLALGCATTPRRPLVTHDDTGSGGGFASLPPLQLQFFGQSAPLVTGSLGVPAYASTISATSITLSAASGANAVALTTGAKLAVGGGVNDYWQISGAFMLTPDNVAASSYVNQGGTSQGMTFSGGAVLLSDSVGNGVQSSGGYLRSVKSGAGVPTAGDCDAAGELGRIYIDTTNNRLYVCNGATRLWDFIALTD